MKAPAAIALTLGLTAPGLALAASATWREDATREDVERLARVDSAWASALEQARRSHPRELRALGILTDPRAALDRPHPTPGPYRCRTIKLGAGSGTGLGFVAYGWFRCRVDLSPGGDLTIRKLTGSQRPVGRLYPDTRKRLVYLGAVAWGAGEGDVRYGQDALRDQVGVLERIGPERWRLVLPWPKVESTLDIMELRR